MYCVLYLYFSICVLYLYFSICVLYLCAHMLYLCAHKTCALFVCSQNNIVCSTLFLFVGSFVNLGFTVVQKKE